MRRYTVTVQDRVYAIDVQELTAERFSVLVDGQPFEVTLSGSEDLAEALISPALAHPATAASQLSVAPVLSQPVQPSAPRPVARPAASPPSSQAGTLVSAPMPGLIVALDVAPGQRVTHGQVLLTLEAMKMQNAIKSPQAGVVAEVLVQPGQSVRHGHALIRLEQEPL